MDPWVGDQVGLELGHIHIQCSIESQGGSQGRDHLRDQSVQVGVGWPLDVQISPADVVDGLIVEHDSDISVLQEGMG